MNNQIINSKYRYTYTATASAITLLNRHTTNAILMYYKDHFASILNIHNLD